MRANEWAISVFIAEWARSWTWSRLMNSDDLIVFDETSVPRRCLRHCSHISTTPDSSGRVVAHHAGVTLKSLAWRKSMRSVTRRNATNEIVWDTWQHVEMSDGVGFDLNGDQDWVKWNQCYPRTGARTSRTKTHEYHKIKDKLIQSKQYLLHDVQTKINRNTYSFYT